MEQSAFFSADSQTRCDRLPHFERLALIGTLTAGIVHDIKTPLSSLLMNLSILEEHLAQIVPELAKSIDFAGSAARRIESLLKTIDSFSRPESKQSMSFANVEDTIRVALRLAKPSLRSTSRVIERFSQVPMVRAHEAQLGQVWLNLILNAAQAMTQTAVSEEILEITTTLRTNGQIQVAFRDTGPGIAPENIKRIFDPFFSTKSADKGCGLGLYISKCVLESLGGSIRAESIPGRGASFIVTLPAFDYASSRQQPL
jgi:signal transduction histidine kinase